MGPVRPAVRRRCRCRRRRLSAGCPATGSARTGARSSLRAAGAGPADGRRAGPARRDVRRRRAGQDRQGTARHRRPLAVGHRGAGRRRNCGVPRPTRGRRRGCCRPSPRPAATRSGEMRRLVGVLRSGGPADADHPDFAPAPGATDIPELVDQVRRAGIPVDLTVTGTARQVGPGAGLTLYRVVQESLTNVIKHAGPGARAEVSVHYGPTDVLVTCSTTAAARRPIWVATSRPRRATGCSGCGERVAVAGRNCGRRPAARRRFHDHGRSPGRGGPLMTGDELSAGSPVGSKARSEGDRIGVYLVDDQLLVRVGFRHVDQRPAGHAGGRARRPTAPQRCPHSRPVDRAGAESTSC